MTDSPALTLNKVIDEYLQWMIFSGYSSRTYHNYRGELNTFLHFIIRKQIDWDDIFTLDTLKDFQKSRQTRDALVMHNRRVLAAFNDYLAEKNIDLPCIRIEQIDAFMTEFTKNFGTQTKKIYRIYLRGFLRYLYHERKILKKDLAPLLRGAVLFARSKPPKFLRPHEIKQLFDSLTLSSSKDIRNYAMIHLAYNLGLRHEEISQIKLDDISFVRSELTLKIRKNNRPQTLPIAENTLKAIAAYVIGARPKSNYRRLFLNLVAPYRPISANIIGWYITGCIRKAGLPGTAYWLRHTYAQNLLEAGASIYEIKEMLGHDSIESTRIYLYIHVKLMRKVLFDEEL